MQRLIIFTALFCFAWKLPPFAKDAELFTAVSLHIQRLTAQVDRIERLASRQRSTHGEFQNSYRNLRVSWAAFVQADRRVREFNASHHIVTNRAYYRAQDHLLDIFSSEFDQFEKQLAQSDGKANP